MAGLNVLFGAEQGSLDVVVGHALVGAGPGLERSDVVL